VLVFGIDILNETMKTTLYKATNLKTIAWANGTSTELFIFPENGDFLTRNFLFRISTATVEAETSTFSFFEGIERTLMILEGNLVLEHVGRYSKELKTFDQDSFSGEWDTKSIGKVKDFNLMCKKGASGSVQHYPFSSNESNQLELKGAMSFIYVQSGVFACRGEVLSAGDTLQIQKVVENEIEIKAKEGGDLVFVEVVFA
jgi:environmental stress-induced protein Ves